MPELNLPAILHTATFLVGSVAIVFGGKLARDALATRRGHRIGELITVHDNPAVALEQSAFLLASVIGLLGALVISGETLLQQGIELALTGVVVIAALLGNDWLTAKLICRGFDNHKAVNEDHNVAVACVRGASALATGFVLRGALGHDSSLLDRVLWVLVGQVALVTISLLYQRLTPYDDIAEIKSKNLAAALPMAGVLLAVGLTVEATLHGEGAGWAADLLSVSLDLLLAVVLLQVLRVVTDLFLLPGTTLHKEIAEDRNTGAGLMEFTSLLLGALLLAYYLN